MSELLKPCPHDYGHFDGLSFFVAPMVFGLIGLLAGSIAGRASCTHDTLRAEAVSRGYAEWVHPEGKRDAEFVWKEPEWEGHR